MKANFISTLHFLHTFKGGKEARVARILLEDYYKRKNTMKHLNRIPVKQILVGTPYTDGREYQSYSKRYMQGPSLKVRLAVTLSLMALAYGIYQLTQFVINFN